MNAPIIELNWGFVMILANIAILYFILKRFFFEKIHNFMQARENNIKDAFDSADAANRTAVEKLEAYNRKIAQIENEGREIIRKAKAKADAQAKVILDEAALKSAAMVRDAEKEIERQRIKAIGEMKEEVGMLALLAAEKILEKNLESAADQDEVIDKIIKEAGTSGWQN